MHQFSPEIARKHQNQTFAKHVGARRVRTGQVQVWRRERPEKPVAKQGGQETRTFWQRLAGAWARKTAYPAGAIKTSPPAGC